MYALIFKVGTARGLKTFVYEYKTFQEALHCTKKLSKDPDVFEIHAYKRIDLSKTD